MNPQQIEIERGFDPDAISYGLKRLASEYERRINQEMETLQLFNNKRWTERSPLVFRADGEGIDETKLDEYFNEVRLTDDIVVWVRPEGIVQRVHRRRSDLKTDVAGDENTINSVENVYPPQSMNREEMMNLPNKNSIRLIHPTSSSVPTQMPFVLVNGITTRMGTADYVYELVMVPVTGACKTWKFRSHKMRVTYDALDVYVWTPDTGLLFAAVEDLLAGRVELNDVDRLKSYTGRIDFMHISPKHRLLYIYNRKLDRMCVYGVSKLRQRRADGTIATALRNDTVPLRTITTKFPSALSQALEMDDILGTNEWVSPEDESCEPTWILITCGHIVAIYRSRDGAIVAWIRIHDPRPSMEGWWLEVEHARYDAKRGTVMLAGMKQVSVTNHALNLFKYGKMQAEAYAQYANTKGSPLYGMPGNVVDVICKNLGNCTFPQQNFLTPSPSSPAENEIEKIEKSVGNINVAAARYLLTRADQSINNIPLVKPRQSLIPSTTSITPRPFEVEYTSEKET